MGWLLALMLTPAHAARLGAHVEGGVFYLIGPATMAAADVELRVGRAFAVSAGGGLGRMDVGEGGLRPRGVRARGHLLLYEGPYQLELTFGGGPTRYLEDDIDGVRIEDRPFAVSSSIGCRYRPPETPGAVLRSGIGVSMGLPMVTASAGWEW